MAESRTALFSRHQPGGVWTIENLPEHPGNIWFVDSGATYASDAAGFGKNPDKPFATLDYAIGNCTASNGDVIYVMPGHAEAINTASGIDVDVAGVSIIGLGKGSLRPTITCGSDETATTVTLASAGMSLENVLFVAGVDSLAVMIEVDADDVTINNCEFREGSAKQALVYIDVDGGGANECDRFKLYNSRIMATTDGANSGVELGQVQEGVEIVGNYIDGDFANAGIYSAAICTNLLIRDNIVANRETGDHAIELTGAATGFCIDNRLYGDTLGTILDPGSLKCLGNLETDAIDQAGVDSPRTSAGGLPADSITAAAIADDAIDVASLADDTHLGADNNNNAFASTSVVANADGSILERLEYIQANATPQTPATFVPHLGYRVSKTEDVNTATSDDLFTVTGKVLITLWTIEVTNVIGAQPNDYILRIKTDNTALTASTDISTAAIGVIMNVTGDAADTLETAGEGIKTCDFSDSGMTNRVVGLAGGSCVLQSVRTAGDASDAMIHTLFYLPLEASASVAAAA